MLRWSLIMMEDDKNIFSKFSFFTFLFSHSLTHTNLRYAVLYQKRYNRDRKYRFKLQKQIEEEYEKHSRLEEILKKSGTTEALKKVAGE